MKTHSFRNAAVAALIPLGLIIAYVSAPGGPRAVGVPVASHQTAPASGEMMPEADKRIAPLLGTWRRRLENGKEIDEERIIIKLLSADPGLPTALGFEAPFTCAFTHLRLGSPRPKPYALAFVDPDLNPPHITFLTLGAPASDGGPPDGFPGIYRVEGNTLMINTSSGRAQRPRAFEKATDRSTNLEVYRRVSDEPTAQDRPK